MPGRTGEDCRRSTRTHSHLPELGELLKDARRLQYGELVVV